MAHRRKGNVRVVLTESKSKTRSGSSASHGDTNLIGVTYYKNQKGPKPAGSRKSKGKR